MSDRLLNIALAASTAIFAAALAAHFSTKATTNPKAELEQCKAELVDFGEHFMAAASSAASKQAKGPGFSIAAGLVLPLVRPTLTAEYNKRFDAMPAEKALAECRTALAEGKRVLAEHLSENTELSGVK